MDNRREAVDYDSMDHGDVNAAFVADLIAAGYDGCEALDLGTGTALIPLELLRRLPQATVLAVDAAGEMLRVAGENVRRAGLQRQIRLAQVDAKRLPYADGAFAAVISNSIVHHLPDPSGALAEAWRVTAPGGLLFFRDLFRPESEEQLAWLVDTYADGANEHQRQMFADSLRAALTVDEVQGLVAGLPSPPEQVQATSDRHWTWAARKG